MHSGRFTIRKIIFVATPRVAFGADENSGEVIAGGVECFSAEMDQ